MNVWTENPKHLEEHWQSFEGPLNDALDVLCRATGLLDAEPWLHTLVPFVASHFARGPEFEDRMMQRFGNSSQLETFVRQAINQTRLLEIQRLLTPITVARWRILHAPAGREFVLNDRGWSRWKPDDEIVESLLLPLSPQRALLLSSTTGRIVLFRSLSGWCAGTQALLLSADEIDSVNQATAQFAFREIYASSSAALLPLRSIGGAPRLEEPGNALLPHGHIRVPGEFDWHRLAAFVAAHSPLERLWDPLLDYQSLAKCPHAPVLVLGANTRTIETSGILPCRSEYHGAAVQLETFLDAYFAAGSPEDTLKWILEAQHWFFEALRIKADGELPLTRTTYQDLYRRN